MQEQAKEKPKVPVQKPAIAAKPKYIPPVKLKRLPRDDVSKRPNPTDPKEPQEVTYTDNRTVERYSTQMEMFPHYPYQVPPPEGFKNGSYVEYTVTYEEYSKCDKFSLHQKQEEATKAPNSPSTVCCSILSNASADCCGVIPNKKELSGKSITKVDSVDSNSSDSGGFKDFVQLDVAQQKQSEEKEASQRRPSQSDYSYRQSAKPNVPNAQALAQYLPQQDERTYKPITFDRTDECGRLVGKLNVAQTSQLFLEKTEERNQPQKNRPQIIPPTQFQQSSKRIEELLSQRYDKERAARRGQSALVDGESSQDVEEKMMVQKQIQQKLQADLQQTVKQIQEIQSIELRLPQNRKWSEVIFMRIRLA